MRDWSGMLDHSLSYEYDFYKEESKKYPKIRDKIMYSWKKYLCIKCNYLTQEIVFRWEDKQKPGEFYGEFVTITLNDWTNHKTVKESSFKTEIKSKSRKSYNKIVSSKKKRQGGKIHSNTSLWDKRDLKNTASRQIRSWAKSKKT